MLNLPLLSAVLAASLSPAPCDDALAPAASIGPRRAPVRVDAWLDPASGQSLGTFLELRRLVAEHEGRLAVDVHVLRTGGLDDPRDERVRVWAAAVASQGKLLEALRLVAREGADRAHARLGTKRSRAVLAEELGIPAARHERWWDAVCVSDALHARENALTRELLDKGTTVYRLPIFAVQGELFEDGAGLGKLRPMLGRLAVDRRRDALREPPAPPEPQPRSERLQRPKLRGAVLGGVGLPHVFVLMAREEDDTNLLMLLPPVLAFRSAQPGRLAVQVVSRGESLGASELRHRLCAARELGRIVEYLRYLATEPSLRPTHPATKNLLTALDEFPEDACEQEPDPAQMGLPDGGWLDGIPRTRSELHNLEATLDLLEASQRPLTALLAPRDDDEDPGDGEDSGDDGV